MTFAGSIMRRLAVGLNAAAALGCVALAVLAPSRVAAWIAGGGIAFFALAAMGFGLLLKIEAGAAARRDASAAVGDARRGLR